MSREATITIIDAAHRQIAAINKNAFRGLMYDLLKSIEALATKGEGEDPTKPIVLYRKELADSLGQRIAKPISANHLGNLLTTLKKDNVMYPSPGEEGKSKPRHHTISTFSLYLSKTPETKRSEGTSGINFKQLDLHKYETAHNLGGLPIKPIEIEYSVQDIHLNGLFDQVLQFGRISPDVRKNQKTIRFAGQPLGINAESVNSELMAVSDQRLVRPLLAYCRISLDECKRNMKPGASVTPPNLFVITEEDLCRLLGVPAKRKENRDMAIRMFKRVANVVFDVDASQNSVFRKMASFSKTVESQKIRIRICTTFDEGEDKSGGKVFFFGLDERLYTSMIHRQSSPQFFRAQVSLSKEVSDIIHALYNWVRRTAKQSSPNALWDTPIGIGTIHSEVLPDLDAKYFNSYLNSAISKWFDSEINGIETYIFHGIEMQKDTTGSRHTYRFRVDPLDEVIGNSVIQLAQQRSRERIEKTADTINHWKPSREVINELKEQGASDLLIAEKLLGFKEYWGSSLGLPKNLDKKFGEYVIRGMIMEIEAGTYTIPDKPGYNDWWSEEHEGHLIDQ